MSNSVTPLKILIVEDNLGDYILIEDYLNEEHPNIDLSRTSTFKKCRQMLLKDFYKFDVILLDLSLPDSGDSINLVKEVLLLAGKSPVIVLTGFSNKDFGVKTLSLGISDYLLKDELNPIQLSKSIYYSIERKKNQNQLIESEKKYKSLFDSSPLPMWVLDREDFRFLDVNDAAVEMYGYSREEFMSMNIRKIWKNEEEPEIEKILIKKKKGYFKIKVTHTKKNGERIFLEVQSNPIIFDGVPARVSLINNITSQVEAEQALSLSEQRFKALVQNGSDLVMILDCQGKLSYVSPSAKYVTGRAAKIMVEDNFFTMIHEEDVDMVKEQVRSLETKKNLQIPSYRIRTSAKKMRWIETVFTNLTTDPAVNGIVANSRDITDFVLQERKLRDSLKRYDIMAKATSDTITDYDVKNNVMHYNEGIENIFGFKSHQIENTGEWWDEKIHPDDRARLKKKTAEVYEGGKLQLQIEYRFRCADGSYKYVLDRSYLVKDEQGNPLRMIGSMQDITRMHEYIKTIEKHNARLKDIAWTQSHIVRAPLARIMGLIDLLQTDEDIEDRCQLLENILSSANELDQIIRKISNKTELAPQTELEC